MSEMNTVNLLTRDDEINIAKCIEKGIYDTQFYLAKLFKSIYFFLSQYSLVKKGKLRLSDLITGILNYKISNLSFINKNYNYNNKKIINLKYLNFNIIKKKFNCLYIQYILLLKNIKKYTINHPYTIYELNKLIKLFMEFKLVPKQLNFLLFKINNVINFIKIEEKKIYDLCINYCLIPKRIFNYFYNNYGTNYI